MSTANVQKLRDAVNDAQARVDRITKAIRAATETFDEVRDRHARAALLAEFDDTKKQEKTDLEKEVTKARARVRDLEEALPVAKEEVTKAKDALWRATAGGAFANAEKAIKDREKKLDEIRDLAAKLGAAYQRAAELGLTARQHAAYASKSARDGMAHGAIEVGVLNRSVEAILYQSGLSFLDGPSMSDDPVESLKQGQDKQLTRWRMDLPQPEIKA